MNDLQTVGRWLAVAGFTLMVVGAVVWAIGRFGLLKTFPGTIKINLPGITCIIPLLGSILISVVLTILFNFMLRGPKR